MNQKIRKTALMGACSLLGMYSPVMAANPEVSVEAVQQTTKKVTGTVSDSQGPVIGASVVEKGTTNGVVTDFDGNFTLNVKYRCNLGHLLHRLHHTGGGNRQSVKLQHHPEGGQCPAG